MLARTVRGLLACCFGLVACASASDEDGQVSQPSRGLHSSGRPGMGATLYGGAGDYGVTFRIWAPNARRVWVAGDFNGWNPHANELGNEFNGNFSTDVQWAGRWQKYKFMIEAQDGSQFYKADPRSARMENSAGSSIVHDPHNYGWRNGFGMPPLNETVVYEMHLGTFHRKPESGWKGTWQTAAEKLDYLAGLGVNMIEVMPAAEFPGDESWGYNPSAPMAPESSYGSPDDVKAFVDAAHGRGIGVIMDVVMNHWGPNDLPMWCIDGDCLGNGGAYFYTDHRASTPWGRTRPDYGRPQVRDYIRDTAMMWLHEYRMDGLRWDATSYVHAVNGNGSSEIPEGWNLLASVNAAAEAQPWKMLIAEDFGAGDSVTRSGFGGAGFDTQWDADFVHPMRDVVSKSNDEWRDMNAVRAAITHRFNGQSSQRVIYTESHDEVANGKSRLPETIWPGNYASWEARKRSTLGAAMVFTAPGVPMIFQGQEFLENGHFSAERALDWWKAGAHAGITQLYRDLIHLRRNWRGNTGGLRGDGVNVHHVDGGGKVVAFHRWDRGGPGDDVVVVANFSSRWYQDYRVGMPRGGRWHVRFNSDWNGYSGDFGNTRTVDADANGGGMDGMGQSASFQLGPYSVAIFSQ